MRQMIRAASVATALLAAMVLPASAAELKQSVTYACGSPSGYYCSGIGESFKKLAGKETNGSHIVTLQPTAGSFEIADDLCSGKADAGAFQADAYALRRQQDRQFSRCVFVAGYLTEEAVLVAGPKGTTWGQYRKPRGEGQKWLIAVKAESGAVAAATLIPQNDPAIAENVEFVFVPKDQYDFDTILADIEFGDLDGVLWVQALDPHNGAMGKVSDRDSIDFVATGFQKYADEITVGGRRPAPVYRVANLPIEGNWVELAAGKGRKIPLLMVSVIGGISSAVPEGSREHFKAVFTNSDVTPPTSVAQKIQDMYKGAVGGLKTAWSTIQD